MPTTLSFAPTIPALLHGSRAVLVVAAAGVLTGELPAFLPAPAQALLAELARDTKPGELGAVSGTLTGLSEPRRLLLGVLPDHGSRYNSPSRAESVRRVVAGADLGSTKAGIILILPDPAHLLATVNAVGRALPLYSSKSGASSGAEVQILALDLAGQPIPIPPEVESTMHATRIAALHVDTPPTELNPEEFAARARDLLTAIPRVELREIVGDALLQEGLAGIHAVGRCAVKPPRMLIAQYTPATGGGRSIALVGKGITYDTGGLSLKISGAMNTMKGDCGGAAAVLGAFCVLAANHCKHKLSLILCIAENAVGPGAYKPDDILRMHSGKTVEINNTDAEGRLLLADGVSYATRALGAEVVFDAATLTGAQLISTGLLHAAIVSNDEFLEQTIIAAGKHCGDLVHPLPFAPEFYKQEFESNIADMVNSVKNRMNAQSACAAQFVYWHMDDTKALWCHIDLAGPSFPKNRGTGFGVALLSETIRRIP
ncbi:leucyl aminopeptidase family protein [Nannocystis sp. SCPEA4]|uniref:leucyl aminopeptidase family protein n=1 Tax=Nannocystis sp. SCPEA4 TaxID=2996787 RepID=UPI002270255B|nr:leucyl aminopeptidase family protein [Nannocystis sp. SCPEA4]